jgi:N-acetylglucosamine malate deacetylase 1
VNTVDLLAFGAHPDDVEIGAGGILAKHVKQGYRVAICNLTEAELSSNGTLERRRVEARRAAEILGVEQIIDLSFPDRGLGEREQINRMAQVIRQCKPRIVLAPYFEDRHPDHVACSRMAKEAIFDAGIRKKKTPGDEEAHRVSQFFYYFINDVHQADVIVDISDVYEQKVESILAYQSQFNPTEGEVSTPLNSPTYLAMVRGRDQLWGHQIGALYGEALKSPAPLKMTSLIQL